MNAFRHASEGWDLLRDGGRASSIADRAWPQITSRRRMIHVPVLPFTWDTRHDKSFFTMRGTIRFYYNNNNNPFRAASVKFEHPSRIPIHRKSVAIWSLSIGSITDKIHILPEVSFTNRDSGRSCSHLQIFDLDLTHICYRSANVGRYRDAFRADTRCMN